MEYKMELRKGELVHIPQGVNLWSIQPINAVVSNTQPTTAIYIGTTKQGMFSSMGNYSVIYMNGKEYALRNEHIYPLKN